MRPRRVAFSSPDPRANGWATPAPGRRPAVAPSLEDRGCDRSATSIEHDACSVGFVTDTGGRSRARVLPLALAGSPPSAIAARSPPTASQDGAGIATPQGSTASSPGTTRRAGAGPGIVSVFLPRGRAERAGPRFERIRQRLPSSAGAASRSAWPRRGAASAAPPRPSSRGAGANAAITAGQRRRVHAAASSPDDACRHARCGRRRRAVDPVGLLSDVVYKGPSPAAARSLADLRPDRVRYAIFHQPATSFARSGAWPAVRAIAHNGETLRSRERRGRCAGADSGPGYRP